MNGQMGIAHERLSIVDVDHGAQPLISCTAILGVNGEIYNHQSLRRRYPQFPFTTNSDCEPILAIYENETFNKSEAGSSELDVAKFICSQLDGMFAFVLARKDGSSFIAARDPLGICPLYWGKIHGEPEGEALAFASEMKALVGLCQEFYEFPPGHCFVDGKLIQYYHPIWFPDDASIPTTPVDLIALRRTFKRAVKKRMMCDVPYGVLLSGGLDSSLVASVMSRYCATRTESNSKTEPAHWPRLHSFSIGLKDSPDLRAAKTVAEFLKTVHHSFEFTVQEGMDALSDVIRFIETYDVTTIRASTPMYLMARRIKSCGVKMVLSGEGSDEMFGGYLYFHKAPNKDEFHAETRRKLKDLHFYDLLRANKSMMAWGVETRVPFLDQDFLTLVMSIDPKYKLVTPDSPMEKYILRQAFDYRFDPNENKRKKKPYLPHDVLWRQKEQFSDGVGYGWIDHIKLYAESHVSDSDFENRHIEFPINPPNTKEAYFYRRIFSQYFPQDCAARCVPSGPSVACSSSIAVKWISAWEANPDPSGRRDRKSVV